MYKCCSRSATTLFAYFQSRAFVHFGRPPSSLGMYTQSYAYFMLYIFTHNTNHTNTIRAERLQAPEYAESAEHSEDLNIMMALQCDLMHPHKSDVALALEMHIRERVSRA